MSLQKIKMNMIKWNSTRVGFRNANMTQDYQLVHLTIQECQHPAFQGKRVQKEEDNNSNQEEQEASNEQYSDDYQYEQDRLTDDNAYSEYFRDDFNAGDRFTSQRALESIYQTLLTIIITQNNFNIIGIWVQELD